MGVRSQEGFTIIETMLFLAITALLVVGVMVGTGASLNTQRYRDAVETFKNTVQQQYADLGSVYNDRANTWTCNPATAQPAAEGTEIRGQSTCLVVGKYVQIREGDMTTYTVLAHKREGADAQPNDVAALKTNYVYNVASTNVDTQQLEWGTKIAWPRSGAGSENAGPRNIGLLFVRSPESGSIYTFSTNTLPSDAASINSATFTDMIVDVSGVPGRGERTMCIASGGLFTPGDMAVTINQYASSASAVEVRSNEYMRLNLGDNAPQC